MICRFGQINVRAKSLLSEIPSSELVGIGEKMKSAVLDVIVLEEVHHMSTITLHLLVTRYGAEDDLGEALRREHVKAYASDDSVVFDERQTLVFGVKDEPRDVLARHSRQLVREHILEHEQPDENLFVALL
jgi:hypothetical protein